MKPTVIATMNYTNVTYNFTDCVIEANKARAEGYLIDSLDVKRMWPYFWIREYTMKCSKPILCQIIGDPKSIQSEIDWINHTL